MQFSFNAASPAHRLACDSAGFSIIMKCRIFYSLIYLTIYTIYTVCIKMNMKT